MHWQHPAPSRAPAKHFKNDKDVRGYFEKVCDKIESTSEKGKGRTRKAACNSCWRSFRKSSGCAAGGFFFLFGT